MIRGRRGRIRFTNNPRATVREHPPPYDDTEESAVQVSRAIDTPQALIKACQDAGAEVRPSSKGWVVYGRDGMVSVSPRWGNDRAKQNTLSDLRRAGVDLTNLPQRRNGTTADAPEFPKLVTDGGRPTLAYTATDDTPEPTSDAAMRLSEPARPTPADVPPKRPAGPEPEPASTVTQADMDALLEMLSTLNARVDRHDRRIRQVERAVTSAPSNQDRTREVRERIAAWFRSCPPGFKATAGIVATNLCTDDAERDIYRRQLTRMVELGELEHDRPTGRGGGAAALYWLPTPNDEVNEETEPS